MKKLTTKTSLLFAGLLAAGTLASCGPTNTSNEVEYYDGEAVTIQFASTASETKLLPIIKDYVDEDFKQMYPNITVEYVHGDGYDKLRDNIATQLSVNEQPDVSYCYPDHVALYNKTGKVIVLDDYINDPEIGLNVAMGEEGYAKKSDFVESFYNEGKTIPNRRGETGAMYALPFSKSTEVMFYNKTFFEANKLTVPTTWDEMEAVCAKIKEIDPLSTPLGYDSADNLFITMCEQAGYPYTTDKKEEGYFLYNNPQTREFVKRMCKWFQKGYITTQVNFGGYTSALFTETDPAKTKAYMCVGSTAGASNQTPAADATGARPFEVNVTMIPQVNPAQPKVISQGPSLCMFSHGVDPESKRRAAASWLLTKFLTTCEGLQAEFALKSGYVPVVKTASENEAFVEAMSLADGFANLPQKTIQYANSVSDKTFTSPAFVGSSDARKSVGSVLSGCMAKSYTTETVNDQTVVTVLTDAQLDAEIASQMAKAIAEDRYQAGLD